MVKLTRKYCGVAMSLAVLAWFCEGVIAQEDPESTSSLSATPSNSAPPESTETTAFLEEITVVGEQSLISMRYQLQQAEENMYGLFNELNNNDEFDIVCRTIRITNSYIPRRSCEPVFFSNLRTDKSRFAQSEMRQAFSSEGIDTAILINAFDLIPSDSKLKSEAEPTFELLNEEMLRIALENPDYLEALERLARLKSQYEAERSRRLGLGDPETP